MLVAAHATDKQLSAPLYLMRIFHQQHFLVHEQVIGLVKH